MKILNAYMMLTLMRTPSSALAGALLVSGCILEPELMFVAKNLDLSSYKKI
jgi:hypothetical protein